MSVHQLSATLRRAWAADLTPARLYALLRLRVEIFVVEQKCPYPELDGQDLDETTRHFWLESDAVEGRAADEPIACLRLLEDRSGGFRIGRVCTIGAARGNGLSRRLMAAALAEVGDSPCTLDAQVRARGFYETFGFRPEGAEFLEDGIPHVTMRRPAR
ncbi:MAG TPA: GNAT family N-acetyltransferase [Pseudonocardiaceae bacterium]|jgi:ElaA protein|nr:GNAT family N-acetyltransferase [Pseudonocardiaceae bacterium]